MFNKKYLWVLLLIPFLSFSQSKSDVCNGDFSLPSYKERWIWNNTGGVYSYITFKDGTKGRLFYAKDCDRYYVETIANKYYYNSYSDAKKALYAYKKYGCHLKNYNKNDCD